MRKLTTLLLAALMITTSISFLAACGEKTTETSTEASVTSEEQPAEESEQPAEESSEESTETSQPEQTSEESTTDTNQTEVNDLPNPIATIEMENGKKIVIELTPQYAPNTVNNFVTLAQSGFYDGVTFHRLVPDFVIQGGDPDGTGSGGPGYSIAGEFYENGFKQNVLSHTRGVISMARTMAPDTAGSQFFIVVDDKAITALDAKYAGFGMVKEGMDVVDEIVNVEKNGESPVEPVVIKTITIDTQGVENWPKPVTIAE